MVVEEYSPDAAHLASVCQLEIVIAPFLEPGIKLRIVSIARLAHRLVEVLSILRVGVTRCEIRAAAKPLRVAFFQISKVRMDGGNHRTFWMKDKRDSGREEFRPRAQRNLRGELLRQLSMNGREIDACLLENTP